MGDKTILVVERDVGEAEKISNFFRDYKFKNKIAIVHSKSQALDYIFGTGEYKDRDDHEEPVLLLLDLLSIHTQDLKILKPLQAYVRTQNIPLIILTSSDDQEKEASKYQLGPIGFIRKPLELMPFMKMIQVMGIHESVVR